MRPKRLGSAVALGFGLLATAPYRIQAVPPPFSQEASSAFRDAAKLLGEDRVPRPNSGFHRWSPATTLQQTASTQDHQPMVSKPHGSPFYPDWNVAQLAEQLRAQQLAATPGHGLDGASYPAQYQDVYSHQQQQLPDLPLQPWSYPHPSMQGHQAPVGEQQHYPPDFFPPVVHFPEQTWGQQLATTDGHGLYGGNYAHHHPPPGQFEPAAQPSEPLEYDFMDLLRQPDPGATQSRSWDGGTHPTQHGPSPMDWQLQPQQAPQHEPSPMEWQMQHQHAPQQFPAESHDYQLNPAPLTLGQHYDPPNPVQHAAQYPVPVKKERGPGSHASRFGQAGDDGRATSSSRPSGAFAWEGSSSTAAGWREADLGEHDMPAAASDQLAHSADNTMEGFDAPNLEPATRIVKGKEPAETTDPAVAFSIASLSELGFKVHGESVELLASEAQTNMVKELLEKRFNVENVNIFFPEEDYEKLKHDIQLWKLQYTSLMTKKDSLEWELITRTRAAS